MCIEIEIMTCFWYWSTFFCLLISTDILCLIDFHSATYVQQIKAKSLTNALELWLNFSFIINNAYGNGAANHFASISDKQRREKKTQTYYCAFIHAASTVEFCRYDFQELLLCTSYMDFNFKTL